MMFNKLCIIGVGLIGGSIAAAARQQRLAQQIAGIGGEANRKNLELARQRKIIDQDYYFANDFGTALYNADCVVIATPVGVVEEIFVELKDHWNAKTVYTDVGSTKASVVQAAREVFGEIPANFVPAHPIAGAEKSGVEAARADLFKNKKLILTPLPETRITALESVQQFWEKMGAQVSIMDVNHHDEVLAATSHLPHVLAFSLVDLLGKKDQQHEIFKYAAGGFKDFTRIASSDPTMWLDICMANRDKIIPLIYQLNDELKAVARMLEEGDKKSMLTTFNEARAARQRFLDQYE